MSSPETNALRWLSEEIAARLSQSVESMTGARCGTEPCEAPPVAQITDWWEHPLSFPAAAAVAFGTKAGSAQAIGTFLLEAAGVPADPETIRSTYAETLAQAVSAIARSLGGRLKQDIDCSPGHNCDAPPEGAKLGFCVSAEGQADHVLAVCVSNSIIEAITVQATKAAAAAASKPDGAPGSLMSGQPSTPPSHGSAGSAANGALPRPMEVLYDVELPVSVSFGRAQLLLKDVIKLTTGSIVELNRSVAEPVEVIVNNCVIARGEVVVVEGNYGVRIDQIITRQERLRTLK